MSMGFVPVTGLQNSFLHGLNKIKYIWYKYDQIYFTFSKIIKYHWCKNVFMSSEVMGAVTYECMSCGTNVTAEELSYLPEIKCICGFRVFRKVRQPIIKQLKAI